ncbi:hypothetical protein OAY20_05380 [Candidatus Pelagibacter bacterium]|nr:hypothetical protein [Candidatus Pelagibacter bacterium]
MKTIKILNKCYVFGVFLLIILALNSKNSFALDSQKSEFGVYFGNKLYEERHPVDNSFFMSQDGWMMGLIGNYETYTNDLYSGFKYQLGYGQVDYTSAGTGTMTGIPDYQLEGTGYIGIPIDLNDNRLTLFGGLGYRYLLNASGLKQSSTGHSGYDRESRYMYVPLGLNYEISSTNDSYWELRGEYLHFLYGQQTSKLGQVSANYSDITNDQEEGSGIKLRAKFHFDSNSGIEGYIDFWDIADSKLDVTGNFMEPRNTTSETGIRYFKKY